MRISLSNKYSSEYGLESGLPLLSGQRLSSGTMDTTANASVPAGQASRIETERVGMDGRYKRPAPTGMLTNAHQKVDWRRRSAPHYADAALSNGLIGLCDVGSESSSG